MLQEISSSSISVVIGGTTIFTRTLTIVKEPHPNPNMGTVLYEAESGIIYDNCFGLDSNPSSLDHKSKGLPLDSGEFLPFKWLFLSVCIHMSRISN